MTVTQPLSGPLEENRPVWKPGDTTADLGIMLLRIGCTPSIPPGNGWRKSPSPPGKDGSLVCRIAVSHPFGAVFARELDVVR